MKQTSYEQMLNMGIAISGEKNYDELLGKIIDCAMTITNCDGGTLYLFRNGRLQFCIMKSKSLLLNQKGINHGNFPAVELDEKNVCAYSAIHRKPLNIKDVYECEEFNFAGPAKYDAMTGYRTKSMMVFPLIDFEDRLVGVVQLINAMDEKNQVIAFDESYNRLLQFIGSEAAIAVSNKTYIEEIEQLIMSITEVFTEAVDIRNPYNFNHSKNVHHYMEILISYIDEQYKLGNNSHYYDEVQKKELLLTAQMHDIGKLAIPNEIINKESRLGYHLELIKERLLHINALTHIKYLKKEISEDDWYKQTEEIREAFHRIQEINKKYMITTEEIEYIKNFGSKTYEKEYGGTGTYLSSDEIDFLTIPRGNLTKAEREIICSHVKITEEYLQKINFGNRYPNIVSWAGKHHEFLDGTGYPRGLRKEDIPFEARMLTVCDVYDALTSTDRPYKKTMESDTALQVLQQMVEEGKLDQEVVNIFHKAIISKRENKNV